MAVDADARESGSRRTPLLVVRFPASPPAGQEDLMKRPAITPAVALAVVSISAQQTPPPQAPAGAPRAGRRGGGPPGGGPEVGMNTRPPNGEGQRPPLAGQTRAPEEKLNVAIDVVTVSEGLAHCRILKLVPKA
jgi:hypothetical protein